MNRQSFSQTKKQFRTEVTNLLTKAGFSVIKANVHVDDCCDPGVGILVTLKGKETPELRKKAETTLNDFSYNITFKPDNRNHYWQKPRPRIR